MGRRRYMWIYERLLFGLRPCMYAPCERDAKLLVAINWVKHTDPCEHGFSVFPMCEWHADRDRVRRKKRGA